MRIPPTVLVCLALVLPACGENRDEAVQETVRDFVSATNDSDPRACDELVTERYLERQTALDGEAAREACREQLKTLGGVEVIVDRFESTNVDGDTAVVIVELRTGGVQEKRAIELVRNDGRWQLDGGEERR